MSSNTPEGPAEGPLMFTSQTGGAQAFPSGVAGYSMTTRQRRGAQNADRQPAFPPLRKHSTTDHIDTLVLDPHDDHHPLDEQPDEDDVEEADDGQQRQSPSRMLRSGSGSDQTLAEEGCHIPESTGAQAKKSQGEKTSDLSSAEKGRALGSAGSGAKRSRAATGLSSRHWKDPETRDWKDDIVTFDTADDPANPKNWSFKRKTLITMLLGLTTMCSTFASSVFSPALPYVARQYGISEEVAVLGISLFVLGYVPGPILFAPLSEVFGRKWSTLGPVFISICFAAGTAVAKDVQTIMLTRFFAGLFASAPVTNVGGGLADMWDTKERATAVVFYSLAVVAGPNLGPIVGGAVSQSSIGWRWTEYLTVILTSTVLVLDLIFLPETFAPVLLTKKAQKLRWKTGRWALHSRAETVPISFNTFLHRNLLLPLQMIVKEPMVTCITTYNSFAYGILYMLFSAVPIVYEQGRGWNSLVGSLPFLSTLLGCFTAAAINITYSQKVFVRRMEKHGSVEPEWRLPPMILGSACFPIGFFILGWTSDPSIHWFPSVVGLYFIGASFLLIFQAGINYLLDAYTKNAASAVAANTFMRSIFAAALPLVARPMYNNLGVNWACTLLGCVGVLLAGIPLLFFKYGAKLRSMSRLAAHS